MEHDRDPTLLALQCLAEENGESADALLTRELHGWAYAHRAHTRRVATLTPAGSAR